MQLEVAAEVDSTNSRLLERARAGDTTPCLLLAHRQTAGRGRMGRSWWSDTARTGGPLGPASLTFSIGVRLEPQGSGGWSGLSLAVGVALAESLGNAVRIKWPNDLWLQTAPHDAGRKLGGVLIETLNTSAADGRGRHAVIGVGINLEAPGAQAGITQPVAGWREVAPQATAAALLDGVAPAVLQALADFERSGFAAFESRFACRDALAGRPVRRLSEPVVSGLGEGVDASGALRVRTATGLQLIDSGEVIA
jgi:BirA family biotin operon repressor/biotin-[acetyl-CoA-carboxylase] ligase